MKKSGKAPTLELISVMTADPAAARKAFAPLDAVREGNHLARNLVNEPANVFIPSSLPPARRRWPRPACRSMCSRLRK